VHWYTSKRDALQSACVCLLAVPEMTPTDWTSDRPELTVCTPHQLLEDMRKFLEVRRGKQLQASSFPEAILNGTQLDLNALYRAVCSRGGYGMGSGVNWAGQVSKVLVLTLYPQLQLDQRPLVTVWAMSGLESSACKMCMTHQHAA